MEWYTAAEEVTIMCEMEMVTRVCLFPLMALGSGEDALLDPGIPLVSRGAFHNTADILPPATGPPVTHLHLFNKTPIDWYLKSK